MPALAIVEFTIAAIFAISFIGLFSGKNSAENTGLSRTCLIFGIAWLVIDGMSYSLTDSGCSFWLQYIVNLFAFAFGNIVIIVFIRYRESYIKKRTELNPWLYRVPIIAFSLCAVAVVIEYLLGHIVEYRDGANAIIYGTPIYIMVVQVAVLFYLPFVALSKRKSIGMRAVFLLGFFDFIPVISSVAAMFMKTDLTVVFSSVEFMLMVTFLQKNEAEAHLYEDILHKETETKLQHEKLRSEVLSYMIDNDDDPIELLKHFAERIRALIECDQVIYRDLEETRIMVNSPAIEDTWAVPIEFCRQCEHFDAHHPMYAGGYTEMDNCQEGWQGIPVYRDCPIKSSLTRIVYCDGETAGYLAIHYVQKYHHFNDVERNTLEEFTRILSISLSRYKAKKENKELKIMRKMQAQLEENNRIIGALSEDFGCVNYVFLTDDSNDEITVNYRTSELLKRLIPGWDLEPSFSKKIMLLLEYAVYEPDRNQFFVDTRRENVMSHLKESDIHFVNTRLKIDNEIRYYQLKFSAIREGGEVISVVAGLHSIDEQMKKELEAQENLAKALEGAQAANRAKTAFLFNMSHDIRTPMNAILGYADMSLSHLDNREAAQEYLHKLKSSGEHLLNLINDILEMSRIEAGKLELVAEPMDIRKSADRIEAIGQALATSKNISFEVNAKDISNPYILADELHLDEVIINVISNAMKYSHEEGRVTYTISQTSDAADGRAEYRFEIRDNGIGMSDEFREHIFETFAREKTATVSKVEGTGLGLSIVKRIVDLAGGRIDIQSRLGEGTTVVIELPLQVMDEAAIDRFISKEDEATDIGSNSPTEGSRILVVEDNAMNREIMEDILKETGLVTESAEDGDIAVNMVTEKGAEYYDLILMDIQMPVMNGYDATRAIRKLPGGDKIPIVAVSANAFEEDVQKSIESGMNAHVAKPIHVDELFRVMAQYI